MLLFILLRSLLNEGESNQKVGIIYNAMDYTSRYPIPLHEIKSVSYL